MDQLDVADWRRRISTLYATVRAEPDPPTAHLLWRHGRDDLLSRHRASPFPTSERDGYGGADVAAYDPAYRFVVTVEPLEPVIRTVEAGDDPAVDLLRIGRVNLPGLGTLDVWWLQAYGGGIFLPVRDRATTSYQGGRYLWDSIKGADLGATSDAMVVDLNFSYQPSCAYSPQWTCPLPGPGNTLAVEVPVGERYQPEPDGA
ncbi:MAG: DUF1684 domain-containing protein [Candidatus Nanopelagicales bacterium]